MVTILHRLQLLCQPLLVLPLRQALVAAAVEGSHEEQEGCHADNGDDEGHAEAVLRLLGWPLVPKLHVTDSHLFELVPFVFEQLVHVPGQEVRLDSDFFDCHRLGVLNRYQPYMALILSWVEGGLCCSAQKCDQFVIRIVPRAQAASRQVQEEHLVGQPSGGFALYPVIPLGRGGRRDAGGSGSSGGALSAGASGSLVRKRGRRSR